MNHKNFITAMKAISKFTLVLSCAGLLMGNKSCQKKAAPPEVKPRILKKIIDLGQVQAQPIQVPGGNFDFQFVANQQIYGVVQENGNFAVKYNSIMVNPNSVSSDLEMFHLSSNDQKMIRKTEKETGKATSRYEYSKVAWCFVDLPQAIVAGAVNGFEMIGGKGLSVGYSPGGTHGLTGIGANFNVEYAQLDLSFAAYRPLTHRQLAATNVSAKQTKKQVSFGIDFGLLRIGPSYYHSTPLASVTKNGLTDGINQLANQMKSEAWQTRVMINHDTHLTIVGGKDLNLEIGDQLLVYNEDYVWDGAPCESQYRGGGAAPSAAVAKIELDWVGDEISRGVVIEHTPEDAVVGAKVVLFKMHNPDQQSTQPGVQP